MCIYVKPMYIISGGFRSEKRDSDQNIACAPPPPRTRACTYTHTHAHTHTHTHQGPMNGLVMGGGGKNLVSHSHIKNTPLYISISVISKIQ